MRCAPLQLTEQITTKSNIGTRPCCGNLGDFTRAAERAGWIVSSDGRRQHQLAWLCGVYLSGECEARRPRPGSRGNSQCRLQDGGGTSPRSAGGALGSGGAFDLDAGGLEVPDIRVAAKSGQAPDTICAPGTPQTSQAISRGIGIPDREYFEPWIWSRNRVFPIGTFSLTRYWLSGYFPVR